MTDAPPSAPAPTPQPNPSPSTETTDWKAEADRLTSELQKARKWEERAKANAAAAQRLAEIEGPQKTELEQAIERAAKAEARVTEFETAAQVAGWKTEIAEATKVPAQYLRGTTKEELQAHADELKPLFENRGPIVPTVGQTPTTAPNDDRATVRRLFHPNQ